MPEGPELHLASLFVNKMCSGLKFGGKVEKSEVSKNPEVPFSCPEYSISAVSRGKEVKLILTPASKKHEVASVVFRFGMSGSFKFTTVDEMPKHAHLRFYTKGAPRRVLSFVDPRRFGSWEYNGLWQPERGPCVMMEYEQFRENVFKHLKDKAFDKPICETMLNQKYFNGIGNYLRAEILYRLQIPPFMQARAVLEAVMHPDQKEDLSLSKKVKTKKENPDFLQLCHLVPLEVIGLGGKGYDPGHADDYAAFSQWLQCYYVPGMKSMRDSNGRTIWFQGDPGPLAPKGSKGKNTRKSVNVDHKPPKAKTTTTKRKSLKNIKKEEDLKVESDEETAPKKRRRVKEETVPEDPKVKKERKTQFQKGKKTNKEAVGVVRKTPSRLPAPKAPANRGRATLQKVDSAVTPSARSRRQKTDAIQTPRNGPKPRQLKSHTKAAPRNSPRTQRKAAGRKAKEETS